MGIGHKQERYVHRVAYQLYTSEEPDTIDHLCMKPLCVRLDHIESVTQAENNARIPRPLACPKGHLYTNDNLYHTKQGWRICRTCRLDQMKKQYRANAKVR